MKSQPEEASAAKGGAPASLAAEPLLPGGVNKSDGVDRWPDEQRNEAGQEGGGQNEQSASDTDASQRMWEHNQLDYHCAHRDKKVD